MTPEQELQVKIPIAVLFYTGIYAAMEQSALLGVVMMWTAFCSYRAVSRYEGWGG